jgi:hypothetical protein
VITSDVLPIISSSVIIPFVSALVSLQVDGGDVDLLQIM